MRGALLVVPMAFVMLACGAKEEPAADTSAATAAPAPAGLTEADVAGTWTGTSMMEGSDSVVVRWKQVCGGGTCKGTAEGQADTVTSTYTLSADSSIGVSQPYMEPVVKAQVVENWVARVTGNSVNGSNVLKLAGTDSVIARMRFTGTRQP